MSLTKDIQTSFDKFASKVEGVEPSAMHTNTSSSYIFHLTDVILSVDITDCSLTGQAIKFHAMTLTGDTIGDKYYKLNRRQHTLFEQKISEIV